MNKLVGVILIGLGTLALLFVIASVFKSAKRTDRVDRVDSALDKYVCEKKWQLNLIKKDPNTPLSEYIDIVSKECWEQEIK